MFQSAAPGLLQAALLFSRSAAISAAASAAVSAAALGKVDGCGTSPVHVFEGPFNPPRNGARDVPARSGQEAKPHGSSFQSVGIIAPAASRDVSRSFLAGVRIFLNALNAPQLASFRQLMYHRLMKIKLVLVAMVLIWPGTIRADLWDLLGLSKSSGNPTSVLTSSLSQEQIVQGLKEALAKGVQHAVTNLGHEGGFLTNLNVKIPIPTKLQSVEKTLRFLKQDKLADEFIATMNHAAEQAVPQAAGVFGDAITGMTISDAENILTGTNNAATQYFRRVTETNLFARFLPIVKQSTDQAGVTSAYKRFIDKAGQGSVLGSLGESLLGAESVDLDSYVTNKALDGLFTMVAQEEVRIRENPVARTSELLQKVFGAVSKSK